MDAGLIETGAEKNLRLFLDVELLHSLGCYREAGSEAAGFDLGGVFDTGGALRRTRDLNAFLYAERDKSLKSETHDRHPDPRRDPSAEPERADEPVEGERGLLLEDMESRRRLRRITDFYSTGIAALNDLLTASASDTERPPKHLEQMGICLFWDREPASSFHEVNERFGEWLGENKRKKRRRQKLDASVRSRIEGKRDRFLERRVAVEAALKPQLSNRGEWDPPLAAHYAKKLLRTDLTTSSGEARNSVTPGFVLQCLVAAHLRLHYVEHFLSLPFERAIKMSSVETRETLERLQEAESLNTFVYVVSRSMPWLFARGQEEREAVVATCLEGFGAGEDRRRNGQLPENDPTVFGALWRSQRLSFLALHRRAFGHSLRDALVDEGFNDMAFKDFHKLQRLLRVQRRVLDDLKTNDTLHGRFIPLEFVVGLDALAETHIGDLYRADHAHPVALKHFCDAVDRLKHLSEDLLDRGEDADPEAERYKKLLEGPPKVALELQDSRWRVQLMMSKGKGFYEAGNLKRSVKWLLKSWSALLVLIHSQEGRLQEGREEAPAADVDDPYDDFERLSIAIDSLDVIKNDPDFSKEELADKVGRVVERAVDIHIPANLRVIASEILLRLGHVLFVLRLDSRELNGEVEEDHALAKECLDRAEELDEYSTLVKADQLKIANRRGDPVQPEDLGSADPQWPYGRGNPEQLIRVIEYQLLRWLAVQEEKPDDGESPSSPQDQDRRVARELISGLLTHTDSINVRQSQVYRYLMQPNRPAKRIGPAEVWQEPKRRDPLAGSEETAIEFVCLRRYSSFFPFVPRPSAFRSLGGGYLLRLHHQDDSCPSPFGIAVDPGPDYIENLYRCGFGLGDINMVILTHDHPDHSVDLTPIFSLMGYRMKHGDETFLAPDRNKRDSPARRLLVVGNESVARQLSFFNKAHVSDIGARMRPDAVQVVSFDEFDAFFREAMALRERNQPPEVAIPDQLRLKPVVSIRHPDGFGMLSYGFRLSLGDDGPSIGFTSDTGGFLLEKKDKEDDGSPWEIRPHDQNGTMKLCGDRTWREHWEPVLDADVLIPHVSGLPLSQLLVLANDGLPHFDWSKDASGKKLAEHLREAWNGLEKDVRKQVTFAFWLPQNKGSVSLPLESIEDGTKWPRGHLYLIGLLEFARAYKLERERVDRPGLLLVGELREELGSLRGKIAGSLNEEVFGAQPGRGAAPAAACLALTTDVGLRLMITREHEETQVRVLCSTCDLDNDRTRRERFHEPGEIREVCVKGENEGMFYNCSNHDPSRQTHPVFLERVERYDVFSAIPNL